MSENGAKGDDGAKEESTDSGSDLLSKLMGALNVSSSGDAPEHEQRLASLDLDGVIKFIQDGKAKSIVTMAGAGISTAAGIPDFRSPGTGLYDSLAEYDLPDPMAIFSLDFFREKPEPFFKVAKTFYPESYKPTMTHCLLKLLDDKGLLLRHYTQNIDMLEEKAGLDAEKIVYAHGNFKTSHCIECGKAYDLEWMQNYVLSDKVPKCEDADCGGTVKPDIVFFGESLPPRFVIMMEKDFKEADLLIIMGTSLVVMPFASLVGRVKDDVPRMYINREMADSSGDNWMMFLMGMRGGGLQCGKEGNYRDVFAQGDCDDVCMTMATKLGWKDDLSARHREVSKDKPVASGSCKAAPAASKTSPPKSGGKPATSRTTAKTATTPNRPSPGARKPPPKKK